MICTEYDQWLADQDKTVWAVDIEIHPYSSGLILHKTIYQDDNRPGLEEPNAWVRLKQYRDRGRRGNGDGHVKIRRFHCQFRDHIETLPIEYPSGIYFAKGAMADMLNPHTSNCYVMGIVEDKKVHKFWYRIPEVILYDETWDDIPNESDPRIILNI